MAGWRTPGRRALLCSLSRAVEARSNHALASLAHSGAEEGAAEVPETAGTTAAAWAGTAAAAITGGGVAIFRYVLQPSDTGAANRDAVHVNAQPRTPKSHSDDCSHRILLNPAK